MRVLQKSDIDFLIDLTAEKLNNICIKTKQKEF